MRKNKQAGSSLLSFLLAFTAGSVLLTAVLAKTDIVNQASDIKTISHLKQVSLALRLYQLEHNEFPQTIGLNPQARWQELTNQLLAGAFISSAIAQMPSYDYQTFNQGQNCILRALFSDPDNPLLENDLDGQINGLDCNDPFYCLEL